MPSILIFVWICLTVKPNAYRPESECQKTHCLQKRTPPALLVSRCWSLVFLPVRKPGPNICLEPELSVENCKDCFVCNNVSKISSKETLTPFNCTGIHSVHQRKFTMHRPIKRIFNHLDMLAFVTPTYRRSIVYTDT